MLLHRSVNVPNYDSDLLIVKAASLLWTGYGEFFNGLCHPLLCRERATHHIFYDEKRVSNKNVGKGDNY